MADSLFDPNDINNDQEREALLTKWKDKPQDELLNSKVESDLHIKRLTARLDEMRQDLLNTKEQANQQATLQNLIDQLSNSNREQVATTPANENASTPSYDLNEIKSLIANTIQETKQSESAAKNFNDVISQLKDQYGNNYASVLQDKLTSLELTIEDANALARKSPKAFFNTLGLTQPQQQNSFMAPPKSDGVFRPTGPQKRTRSYYLKMKVDNPKEYYSPKNYVQMEKDAVTLGSDFFDTSE